MVKRVEMITNDDELFNNRVSKRKVFMIITLFICTVIFFLSTTLELKEERAEMVWNTFFVLFLILVLLIYFKVI